MNKLLKYGIVTTALMMFAGGASAAALCSVSNPNPGGMQKSNVTYNGAASNDCYGVIMGNDNVKGTINTELASLWGGSTDLWKLLAKDDTPGATGTGTGTFLGINFSLTTTAGKSGDWALTGTDTNFPTILPTFLDFIVVLKASDRFGAWLLDDVKFDGNDGGTWSINFLNNGGKIPDLSHLSLYVREGTNPPCTDCDFVTVPEPTTLLLMSAGLFGFGLARRRKSA
ncbi:PEP-CTERM sorting domain-containing protein [Candidatus Nitrotoga arctica]|uniref:PEP-CTERM protein-sorting domain-containing protein n=1 Tax=Candidatus Nitrotoga arctica TaxID=453162 RepID=A0ABN8AR83_9PROT|nr:PEP-CTERM sorting domain-containing protein [Candidatus Nitrotoga arctica]CAG9933665.1 PEP-CTERM protein-sorting domain-containing protein [Candidatus Nitrotoga arctica]